mgnify:CR=1 FL=1
MRHAGNLSCSAVIAVLIQACCASHSAAQVQFELLFLERPSLEISRDGDTQPVRDEQSSLRLGLGDPLALRFRIYNPSDQQSNYWVPYPTRVGDMLIDVYVEAPNGDVRRARIAGRSSGLLAVTQYRAMHPKSDTRFDSYVYYESGAHRSDRGNYSAKYLFRDPGEYKVWSELKMGNPRYPDSDRPDMDAGDLTLKAPVKTVIVGEPIPCWDQIKNSELLWVLADTYPSLLHKGLRDSDADTRPQLVDRLDRIIKACDRPWLTEAYQRCLAANPLDQPDQ